MTLSQVKFIILEGCIVWSLGQLDKESNKWLNKEVKKGNIVKNWGLWPFLHSGTCKKVYYHKNYEIKNGMAWDKI